MKRTLLAIAGTLFALVGFTIMMDVILVFSGAFTTVYLPDTAQWHESTIFHFIVDDISMAFMSFLSIVMMAMGLIIAIRR